MARSTVGPATATDVPIFINVRDRVTPLRALVAWLEAAGHRRIVLLDNASSYPPLLEYLNSTQHQVVWLSRNLGCRALWAAGLAPAEWFVYTDPDVVPISTCPLDAVAHLRMLLERFPDRPKAGLGLYIDDLPAGHPQITWERRLVSEAGRLAPAVYAAPVDTTFALYRPGSAFTYEALRTAAPYLLRHVPWYVSDPGEEDRYYLDRAMPGRQGSTWARRHRAGAGRWR